MIQELIFNMSFVVGVLTLLISATEFSKQQIITALQTFKDRIKNVWKISVLLIAVLLFNSYARDYTYIISQQYGIRLTGVVSKFEQPIIMSIQDIAFEELTMYFSYVYVYGYATLLIFPVIAYFVLDSTDYLKKLLTSYILNYSIGLVFYVAILLYGPRNVWTDIVTLYNFQPEMQYITREVNDNTNLFPSLHTSLSTTVMLFAYKTKDQYTYWFFIATIIGTSVILSTVYLGIHWTFDVIGGIVLGVGCFFAGSYLQNNT